MQEIELDFSQCAPEHMAALEEVIARSRKEGAVVGMPWNPKVFEYMFCNGFLIDPTDMFSEISQEVWEEEFI